MINFNKKDPVADAIRDIMEKELKGNQTKLDKNHNGKLDKQDFEILRGQKVKEGTDVNDRSEDTLAGRIKTKKKDDVGPGADFKSSKVKLKAEEAELEENAFDYKSPRQPEPNGGSGVKKGSRYGGSKQKEKPEQEMPKEKNEEVEHIEEKNWIAGAIKHPGAETAAAKRAGMSVQAYASKHQHDSGTAGKRARLAMTLKKMKENYEEPIIDELINEVLSKDADAGDWIHDFVHSDNPKFEGKSKAERKKMALGAYYGKKNEEVNEGLKSVAKKAFKTLTGGSDEDQRKDLQRKMGVPQTGQKPKTEEVKPPVHYGGKGTEGAKFDLYMQKRKQDNAKAAPKTQKEEVVMEGRPPTSQMDTPFVTDAENKPLSNAKELAAKTMKRMKNEMLGKTGTSE
jgi:hypothetical protein